MQVQLVTPSVGYGAPRAAADAPEPPVDTVELTGDVAPPPALKRLDMFVDPATPVGALPRPVLLIPGGNSRKIGLSAIIHYLTVDGNNSFGGSYNVGERAEFAETVKKHGGNVFCLHFSHQFGGPERNAAEIKQAIDDLRSLTGHDEIDVVAECKGAVEFLHYIDQGHDGVRNVALVVPPLRGMPGIGDLLKVTSLAIDKLHLPIKKIGEVKVDDESLKGLRDFGTQVSLGGLHNNAMLKSINSPEGREKQDKAFNSLTVLLGDGRKINLMESAGLPGAPFPMYRGDGWVPRWSGFMENGQNFAYAGERSQHGQMATNGTVMAKIAEALLNDGKVTQDENYITKAPPPVCTVALRSTIWATSAVGRVSALASMATGTVPGPVGMALAAAGAAATAWDGVNQARRGLEGSETPLKASVGTISKLAQTAGLVMFMNGMGGTVPIALIAAGMAGSAWSWS